MRINRYRLIHVQSYRMRQPRKQHNTSLDTLGHKRVACYLHQVDEGVAALLPRLAADRKAVRRREQDLTLVWKEGVGVDVASGSDGDLKDDAGAGCERFRRIHTASSKRYMPSVAFAVENRRLGGQLSTTEFAARTWW